MARQNVRLRIFTSEREVAFFWVSLGLREAHAFGVLVVQNFQSPLLPPMLARSMFPKVRCTNRCSWRLPTQSCHINSDIAGCANSTEIPPCVDKASSTILLSVIYTRRRTDPMINIPICFARSCNGRAGFRRRRCLIRIYNYAW